MRFLVGIDDTDSSRGYCTTYLAHRIAVDFQPNIKVLPYPRLVRLNPNIPFKTRGNAAVCLQIETPDPDLALELISAKVADLSDVGGGANSGMVFLENPELGRLFEPLYLDALSGLVSPHRVRRMLREHRVRTFELGNGMGIVGAASSLAFDERFDHTYELISYRRRQSWGSKRVIDSSSVKEMDRKTSPHTFNNYDYQKRKVLIAPHGPDPVFAGIRGDSPTSVMRAFRLLEFEEVLDGHTIFVSNQHTDAHLHRELDWKVYSSGWVDGTVAELEVGVGGHVYITIETGDTRRAAAAYEPTGDLRRMVRLLRRGDRVRAFGGVRRATPLHSEVLNLEKIEMISSARTTSRSLPRGTYIASPRANRHLTKPLIRYGREVYGSETAVAGWVSPAITQQPALVRNH
jgi:tRNA(Ile2)-agmatinylcytidine synthase